MPFEWLPQQLAVFEAVADPRRGNITVVARAGTGKTTSIVEATKRVPDSLRILVVAFNKVIADELQTKLPPYVEARTFHSLCFRAWAKTRRGRPVTVEAKKLHLIADEMFGRYQEWQTAHAKGEALDSPDAPAYVPPKSGRGITLLDDRPAYDAATMLTPAEKDKAYKAARLAGLAKNEGVGVVVPDEYETWDAIIDRYDLDVADDQASTPIEADEEDADFEDADADDPQLRARAMVIAVARKLFNASAQDRDRIDFDDMLYLCAKDGGRFDRYDLVMCDEAQDLNGLQRHLLRQILSAGGRLVAVGDDRQAIYMFRGAGAHSLQEIRDEFHCTELPLSVSFRCARAIIQVAQQIVPEIQAAPWAKDGDVFRLGKVDLDIFGPEDAVLCRNVAPLLSLAFKLIKHGTGVRMLGRGIGDGLISLIRQMKAKTVLELNQNLTAYATKETKALLDKHKDEQAELLNDKVEAIMAALSEMPAKPEPTVQRLIQRIGDLFNHENERGLLTLSSVHRAKGLEWDCVFILDDWRMPSKYAKTTEAQRQEQNLRYVAYTRAKDTLTFIDSKDIA